MINKKKEGDDYSSAQLQKKPTKLQLRCSFQVLLYSFEIRALIHVLYNKKII